MLRTQYDKTTRWWDNRTTPKRIEIVFQLKFLSLRGDGAAPFFHALEGPSVLWLGEALRQVLGPKPEDDQLYTGEYALQ